jgi:DNA-binding NtrC family response regulator
MSNISSVLVVEDDEQALEALARLLESGLEIGQVRPTRSAEEALAILRRERFALILSDYQLSGMDGVRLLEELRGCGDETPFLILSGVPDTAGVLRALRQTRVDVLGKPFRVSDLAAAMERLRAA